MKREKLYTHRKKNRAEKTVKEFNGNEEVTLLAGKRQQLNLGKAVWRGHLTEPWIVGLWCRSCAVPASIQATKPLPATHPEQCMKKHRPKMENPEKNEKGRKGSPSCQKLTEEQVWASAMGVQENVETDRGPRSWDVGVLIHKEIQGHREWNPKRTNCLGNSLDRDMGSQESRLQEGPGAPPSLPAGVTMPTPARQSSRWWMYGLFLTSTNTDIAASKILNSPLVH